MVDILRQSEQTKQPDAFSIEAVVARIEQRLSELVPETHVWPSRLHAAERHALLSPGKRFRPLLCVNVAGGLGYDNLAVYDLACVSEMVHAASLILDDLPCMDDADLRRSQPTIHIAFDESTAVLAATALLNRSFGILARMNGVESEIRIELVDRLSSAVGSKGLIAGQIADLSNDDPAVSLTQVENYNRMKTGALFDFAILGAAVLGQANTSQFSALAEFSDELGLAFQLLDDLKDQVMSEAESGKSSGRDAGKMTLMALTDNQHMMARLSENLEAAKTALKAADLSTVQVVIAIIDRQFSFMSR